MAEFLQAVGSLLFIAPGTAIPTGLVIKNADSDVFFKREGGNQLIVITSLQVQYLPTF